MTAPATGLLPIVFRGNVRVLAQIVPEREMAGYLRRTFLVAV